MSIGIRFVVVGAAAALLASPVGAQRGATGRAGGSGKPANPSKAQADTVRKPGAVSLDFQDQDLKVVLNALAAAGDLNVSLTNIPSQRVTVHMGRPVTREAMVELVKNVAESNGLKVTVTETLIQIAGPTPEAPRANTQQQTLAQQLLQANQQQQMRLFTYRLHHASAVQLAPVLMNLFSGFAGGARGNTGTTIIPNGNGGFNVIGGNTGAQGGNAGVTNIPAPFGGRAGRGGAAPGGANQLALSFQQATGALSNQAGDIRIIAEESSNSLLIRATDADYTLVQQIIQGVDLRPLQVLIEVTIAEVQRTHDLDVGISGNANRIPKGTTTADATLTVPSQASARDFILELVGGYGSVKYDVALAALQERGDVKVLSLPVIIAQNNRQAILNVGSSRPFVQVSQTVANDPTGRVQTVQYIDVGTVLTITPTINPDGYVNLQVNQQDNSAANEVQFDAPVINKREATTQVFVRDGQTTVIGGLAGTSHSSDISGIPILDRIPYIGPLIFGRTVRSDVTSELFLFLTPHIISSDEDLSKYREAVKDGSDLLKQVNIGPYINAKADTLTAKPDSSKKRDSTAKPDTGKKDDSLTTLRRRPPAPEPRDTTPPAPSDSVLLGSRQSTRPWQ